LIYRPYGNKGFQSSLFGLGCMRLPKNEAGEIDQEHASAMIRHAIDRGVNYVDTAYGYPGSEQALGLALKDGYREKVKIATKLPPREVQHRSDVRKKFEQQCERLKTDFIDYYLIHRIESTTWPEVKAMGMIEEFEALKAQGRIGNIGFSYHDTFEVFREIIDHRAWDMCQVQQNYFDIEREVTEAGIRYAGERGVPVVIMEPLRGGALANVPDDVRAVFDAHPDKRTPIEWAFRHLYNYPEVSCILSGVSTMDQLVENLGYFSDERDVRPNCLSADDVAMLRNAKRVFDEKQATGCTGCFYCMPCPFGVRIPNIFAAYDAGAVFDDWAGAKHTYGFSQRFGGDASACVACGACETACPQHLPIIELLKTVHERLAE
jgi:predicted aldo/keto reductase-like oxidoreductase